MAKYSTCKSCGRPLKFLKTPAGKNMPCDTKAVFYIPCRDGPHQAVTGNGVVVRCIILDKPTRDAKAGLVPHWATCPHASRHRKTSVQPSNSVQTSFLSVEHR